MGQACTHQGAQFVMNVGKAQIYAGGAWDINDYLEDIEPVALISVGGPSMHARATSPMIEFEGDAKSLFSKTSQYTAGRFEVKDSIIIDWPDMGVPPMDKEWWTRLTQDLSKIKGNVAIFCMGGHGRTGTALSLLAGLSGAAEGDVVQWVRDNYCKEAVETASQLNYLEKMGFPSDCDASNLFKYPQGQKAWSPYAPSKKEFSAAGDERCDLCLEVTDFTIHDEQADTWLCKDCSWTVTGPTVVDEKDACVECGSPGLYYDEVYAASFCLDCMPAPEVRGE